MALEDKQYCPICGKRRPPYLGSQTIQNGSFTTTLRFYAGTNEPVCFGHHDAPVKERTVIPRAFYEAFEGEA